VLTAYSLPLSDPTYSDWSRSTTGDDSIGPPVATLRVSEQLGVPSGFDNCWGTRMSFPSSVPTYTVLDPKMRRRRVDRSVAVQALILHVGRCVPFVEVTVVGSGEDESVVGGGRGVDGALVAVPTRGGDQVGDVAGVDGVLVGLKLPPPMPSCGTASWPTASGSGLPRWRWFRRWRSPGSCPAGDGWWGTARAALVKVPVVGGGAAPRLAVELDLHRF
jgi:hypothetical protein